MSSFNKEYKDIQKKKSDSMPHTQEEKKHLTENVPEETKTIINIVLNILQVCLKKERKPHLRNQRRGTWVAQSVKCLTSAQVMISQFVGLSLPSGSVLTVHSLEPTLEARAHGRVIKLPSMSTQTTRTARESGEKIGLLRERKP